MARLRGSAPRTRHRVVLGGAVLIAAALAETAVDHGHHGFLVALAAMTIAPLLLASVLRRPTDPAPLAAGAAATLFAQTVVATVEFGGGVQPTSLLLTMLVAVAVYRSQRVLIATATLAAIAQGVLLVVSAAIRPWGLATRPNDDAVIVSVVTAVLGAWALFVVWNDHRLAERIADERDQLTAAWRDIVPMVSIRLDRDGRLLDANRATCLLLDMEVEDVIGQDWFTLALPPEFQEPGRTFFEQARDGRELELGLDVQAYTNDVVGADGQRRTVQWSSGWVYDADGVRTSLLAVGRDLTDELAAQAETVRVQDEMDALRHLARNVAALDDSRQAVVDAAEHLAGTHFAAIAEPGDDGINLEVTTASDPRSVGASAGAVGDGALARAFRSGVPVVASGGAHGLSGAVEGLARARAVVFQPILSADGPVGVLVFAWSHPIDEEREHMIKLAALASHEAAVSLRRRESIQALKRAALIDPLTGTSNRRAFDIELPEGLRRAAKAGRALSLAVLDLNSFKAVNDTLGHEAGDQLLVDCAEAWRSALRRGDLLVRLGGDEFALLLPSCGETELTEIVERVRRATPHGPGTAIGGTTWDGQESAADLIRRADAAQYADKARCHARRAGAGAVFDSAAGADPTA